MDQKKIGRPTVMTPETILALEDAFKIGCSDSEACFAAGIGTTTLYNYQEENPAFVERKVLLKRNPVFLARTTVVKALEKDSKLALAYLERVEKKEFSLRTEVTGADGENFQPPTITVVRHSAKKSDS